MFSNFIFFAVMGWAGGLSVLDDPGKPAPDDDGPYPPWWWLINAGISIFGGVLGNLLIANVTGTEELAVVGLGALAGGAILTDLGRRVNIVR